MCAKLGDQSIHLRAELPFREIQAGLEAWANSSLVKIGKGKCKALHLEEPRAVIRAGDQQVLGKGDHRLPQSAGSAPGSVAWDAVVLPAAAVQCWLLLSIGLGCVVFRLHPKLCCFPICEFSFKQFLSNQIISLCVTAYRLETHFAYSNKQYKTSAFPEEFIIKYKLDLHI